MFGTGVGVSNVVSSIVVRAGVVDIFDVVLADLEVEDDESVDCAVEVQHWVGVVDIADVSEQYDFRILVISYLWSYKQL